MTARPVTFSHAYGTLLSYYEVAATLQRHILSTTGNPVGLITPPSRIINGDIVVTKGQVVSGVKVNGKITVQNGGVIRDFIAADRNTGTGASRHVVQVQEGGIAEDGLVEPSDPMWHREGVRLVGSGAIARRLEVRGVGDGIAFTGGIGAQATENYLHDFVFISPDPGRGNIDTSHDDAFMIHGGQQQVIEDNEVEAYYAYGPYDVPFAKDPVTGVVSGYAYAPHANMMSGVMVTAIMNDGLYPEGLSIKRNHWRGGVVVINAGGLGSGKAAPWSLGQITDNLSTPDQLYRNHDKTFLLVSNAVRLTEARNFYTDGTPALRRQS